MICSHRAARVFFFHYLVDSVVKDMRQKCVISFFCLKCLMLCLLCAQIHSQSPTIQSPTMQL